MNVDVAAHRYRLWDVENCDTRWESFIPLSPAFNTCTVNPSLGGMDLVFDHLHDLMFTSRAFGSSGVLYKFTPPLTIGSLTYLTDADGNGSVCAIESFRDKTAFVCNEQQGTHYPAIQFVPTYGASAVKWASYPPAHSGEVLPQFGKLGGTMHLMTFDSEKQLIEFTVGDESVSGDNAIRVATTSAVVGTYLPKMVGNGLNVFAQLPRGVFDFDLTPSIVVDTGRAEDLNGALSMFGNNLYFKNKKSLMEYDGDEVIAVGYDKDDGLPGDKWGEITAMAESWKYLFVAVKGATYSHILTMDANKRWEYYARVPSAGIWVREMKLSDAPDSIDRLWLIFGNHGYPGYFLNPMVNPLQAGTYSYVPTGYFTPPQHDGGMIEELGGFYDQKVTADGLGGLQKITCLYGLDGDAPVSTLGVVGTTSDSLTFGSPAGVEGYRIQPKFMLHRGSNTGSTPVFRSAIVHYLKIPKVREVFEFTLDLRETYKKHAGAKSLESIIGSLNYERNTRTLLPFAYGQVATRWVKVLDMPSVEEVTNEEIFAEEREGEVSLKVSELI